MDFREILRASGDLGGIKCIQSSPPRSPPPSSNLQTIPSLEGLTKPTQGAIPGDASIFKMVPNFLLLILCPSHRKPHQ